MTAGQPNSAGRAPPPLESDWHRRFVFLKGAASLSGLPSNAGREVAFSGRSNAGKSSVINALTGQRCAKVSKTPGRTRELNVFVRPDGGCLVDMPGYGFARVSREQKRRWAKLLEAYFTHRRALVGAILIMDARRPLREHDWRMLRLCRAQELPVHILLNKADKLSRSVGLRTLEQVCRAVRDERATAQLFSVHKGQGKESARATLHAWLFRDADIGVNTGADIGADIPAAGQRDGGAVPAE